MKIGLIDNDLVVRANHNFPNLAIMKLSSYHKSIGNEVELIGFNEIDPNSLFPNDFDEIYISKAFTDSSTPDFIHNLDNVKYGGTGFFFDKSEALPFEIEHAKPDYSLYNKILPTIKNKKYYTDHSIGYTTRGCFRHCSFCVNKNSNKVKIHSPINEFYDEARPKLAMLDDNILGLPNRELFKIFDVLGEIGKPFQYRQGMDIRLLTEERIKKLFELRYDGNYYFAFDLWSERDQIIPKMQLWQEMYCKYKKTSKSKSRFTQTKMYLFSGLDVKSVYNDQFWIDELELLFKRIELCFAYGFAPYVMRFETIDKSKFRLIYQNICQWTNHNFMFCSQVTFREFLEGSTALKSNRDFFAKHKQFNKYLDLKL